MSMTTQGGNQGKPDTTRIQFEEGSWPQVLWSAGRLCLATSLPAPQAINLVISRLKSDFGYDATTITNGALEEVSGSAVTVRLAPVPWPLRGIRSAVLDVAAQQTPTGTVITADVRLAYPQVLIFVAMLIVAVGFLPFGSLPGSILLVCAGSFVYIGGRFTGLPSALKSVSAWLVNMKDQPSDPSI
jgi:hypothetical protein